MPIQYSDIKRLKRYVVEKPQGLSSPKKRKSLFKLDNLRQPFDTIAKLKMF